jgi:hypothetical protein
MLGPYHAFRITYSEVKMGIINTGKCPKCESTITRAEIEHLDVTENFQSRWHGISLVCPSCHTVLGAAIDPVALKNDIVELVVSKLRSRN